MRQVYEWRRRAGWIQCTDLTFVEVDCARIEISSRSVGHRQQLKVVGSLLRPAAIAVAAVRDSAVRNGKPRNPAVHAPPDSPIDQIP